MKNNKKVKKQNVTKKKENEEKYKKFSNSSEGKINNYIENKQHKRKSKRLRTLQLNNTVGCYGASQILKEVTVLW